MKYLIIFIAFLMSSCSNVSTNKKAIKKPISKTASKKPFKLVSPKGPAPKYLYDINSKKILSKTLNLTSKTVYKGYRQFQFWENCTTTLGKTFFTKDTDESYCSENFKPSQEDKYSFMDLFHCTDKFKNSTSKGFWIYWAFREFKSKTLKMKNVCHSKYFKNFWKRIYNADEHKYLENIYFNTEIKGKMKDLFFSSARASGFRVLIDYDPVKTLPLLDQIHLRKNDSAAKILLLNKSNVNQKKLINDILKTKAKNRIYYENNIILPLANTTFSQIQKQIESEQFSNPIIFDSKVQVERYIELNKYKLNKLKETRLLIPRTLIEFTPENMKAFERYPHTLKFGNEVFYYSNSKDSLKKYFQKILEPLQSTKKKIELIEQMKAVSHSYKSIELPVLSGYQKSIQSYNDQNPSQRKHHYLTDWKDEMLRSASLFKGNSELHNAYLKAIIYNRSPEKLFIELSSKSLMTSKEQFYQGMLFTCLELNCDDLLYKKFFGKIKSANFKTIYGIGPLYFTGKYNRTKREHELQTKGAVIHLDMTEVYGDDSNTVPDMLISNHKIGYLNIQQPKVKDIDPLLNVYLLGKPKFGSKVIALVDQTELANFDSDDYDYEIAGPVVYGKKGDWFLVSYNGKTGWIHRLYAEFKSIEDELMNGLLSVDEGLVFYDSINGKKLSLKLKAKGLAIGEVKWVNGVLWARANVGHSTCGGDIKPHPKAVWIKPFDKDGIQFYTHYSRGC